MASKVFSIRLENRYSEMLDNLGRLMGITTKAGVIKELILVESIRRENHVDDSSKSNSEAKGKL